MKRCRWREIPGALKIQERLLILLLLISLLSSACYMYWGYMINSHALVNGIDKRLLLAALTFDQLLPQEMFDRCAELGGESYTLEEMKALPAEHPLKRLFEQTEQLRKNAGLEYLYTVLRKPDGSSYFPFGLAVGFNVPYDDPAPDILLTLNDGKIRNTEISDPVFGKSRSVIIRRKTAQGTPYIIGADALLSEVGAAKQDAFLTFLAISTISFLAMALMGFVLARRLSRPIRRLSNFTIELRETEFSEDKPMPPELLPKTPGAARFEIAQLALNIDLFRHALREATRKKERAESELRIAGEIQLNFMPTLLPAGLPIDICGKLSPALEAGGDLYDFMALDDHRAYFAIGDVCGKGMPAALFMAMTLTLMRSAVRQGRELAEIMRFVNFNLSESNENCTFVTLLCGIYDASSRTVTYCNGGNCPPLLLAPGREAVFLPMPEEPPVGVIGTMEYKVHTLVLEPGSVLILFTDGISEAEAADGGFYGLERLKACAERIPSGWSSQRILEYIGADVAAFTAGHTQSDDITLNVVQGVFSPEP